MKLLPLLAVSCLLTTLPAAAALKSGQLHADETWTLAESPVVLTNNVIVGPRKTLVIEPGVVVLAPPHNSRVGLYVQGALRVAGMEHLPVVFESASPSPKPGDWAGILVIGGSAQIAHAVIAHADVGLWLDAVTDETLVTNCAIRDSAYHGLWIAGDSTPRISGCLIENNAGYGLVLDGTLARLAHCVVRRNGAGLWCGGRGSTPEIVNCKFESNEPYGGVFIEEGACPVLREDRIGVVSFPVEAETSATEEDAAVVADSRLPSLHDGLAPSLRADSATYVPYSPFMLSPWKGGKREITLTSDAPSACLAIANTDRLAAPCAILYDADPWYLTFERAAEGESEVVTITAWDFLQDATYNVTILDDASGTIVEALEVHIVAGESPVQAAEGEGEGEGETMEASDLAPACGGAITQGGRDNGGVGNGVALLAALVLLARFTAVHATESSGKTALS